MSRIAHPQLSRVVKLLRPSHRANIDWVARQDADGSLPWLEVNVRSQPVTQAEVDGVTAEQIAAPIPALPLATRLSRIGIGLQELKTAVLSS